MEKGRKWNHGGDGDARKCSGKTPEVTEVRGTALAKRQRSRRFEELLWQNARGHRRLSDCSGTLFLRFLSEK